MVGRLRRPVMRRGPGTLYRRVKSLEYLVTRDRRAVAEFLAAELAMSRVRRLALLARMVAITNAVRGYHTLSEILSVCRQILARSGRPGLTVIEAGCGHGSSTAKLSLAVRAAGGHLHVFDSFRGIPPNDERHGHLDGRPVVFRAGAFRARLRAVERTLARHGAPEVVTLHKGWLADTLPGFVTGFAAERPARFIDVVLLDVDLIASTRTCLIELFPRLRRDGVVISLDGQLRATHDLLGDHGFWSRDVGVPPPVIEGLGTSKQLVIRRAARTRC